MPSLLEMWLEIWRTKCNCNNSHRITQLIKWSILVGSCANRQWLALIRALRVQHEPRPARADQSKTGWLHFTFHLLHTAKWINDGLFKGSARAVKFFEPRFIGQKVPQQGVVDEATKIEVQLGIEGFYHMTIVQLAVQRTFLVKFLFEWLRLVFSKTHRMDPKVTDKKMENGTDTWMKIV